MIAHRKRASRERMDEIAAEHYSVCIHSEESCTYAPGDRLVLREWTPENGGTFTGREMIRRVLQVSRGRYGIRPQFAAVAHVEEWDA